GPHSLVGGRDGVAVGQLGGGGVGYKGRRAPLDGEHIAAVVPLGQGQHKVDLVGARIGGGDIAVDAAVVDRLAEGRGGHQGGVGRGLEGCQIAGGCGLELAGGGEAGEGGDGRGQQGGFRIGVFHIVILLRNGIGWPRPELLVSGSNPLPANPVSAGADRWSG